MIKNVMVVGGAGYVGASLVPKLLKKGYNVTVYDLMIYGTEVLPTDPKLKVIKNDMRNTPAYFEAVKGCDAVIHLACISNDPSFELNPDLGKSINFDCFEPLVKASIEARVKRFIYASSSSVYGVSEAPEVTEEHPLIPLTDYSKFKGMTEEVLLKYQSQDFTTTIIRPATVCGYSARTRLDLSVNILTNLAVNKGKITVFGGSQKRPNIHIDDIANLYVQLLEMPKEKIAGQIFNAGYQNYSITELAEMVKKVVEEEFSDKEAVTIETSSTNDLRSYHVSSKKITDQLGYKPTHTVEDAIRDLCKAFKAGKLPDSLDHSRYFNIKRMKEISLQ
jgi:nucleoside-diphosphate-sugar epimerase